MSEQPPQPEPQPDPLLGSVNVTPRPLRGEISLLRGPGMTFVLQQVATEVGKFGFFWSLEDARIIRDGLTEAIEKGSIEVATEMPRIIPPNGHAGG